MTDENTDSTEEDDGMGAPASAYTMGAAILLPCVQHAASRALADPETGGLFDRVPELRPSIRAVAVAANERPCFQAFHDLHNAIRRLIADAHDLNHGDGLGDWGVLVTVMTARLDTIDDAISLYTDRVEPETGIRAMTASQLVAEYIQNNMDDPIVSEAAGFMTKGMADDD